MNIKKATHPLIITLPDGEQIEYIYRWKINVPAIPSTVIKAHIVPGLTHTFLISIKVICDSGFTVFFDKEYSRVYFENKTIWRGTRENSTGLWIPPMKKLKNSATTVDSSFIDPEIQMANNESHMT